MPFFIPLPPRPTAYEVLYFLCVREGEWSTREDVEAGIAAPATGVGRQPVEAMVREHLDALVRSGKVDRKDHEGNALYMATEDGFADILGFR